MADSFQKEVPKARINITLDVETEGARRKKELPLKILALGDFSNGKSITPLAERERITLHKNNFDQVLATFSPTLQFSVPNKIKNDATEFNISLTIKQIKDFHPDVIVSQVPALNQLLSMRNLLKDLKAHLLDNNAFRKTLENLTKNKTELLQLQDELASKAPLSEEG